MWRRPTRPRRRGPQDSRPDGAPRSPASARGSTHYLVNRFADSVVLTFGQLEDLLGGALPDSARAHQEWWTNKDTGTSSCAEAWILAGRTAKPNLMARTVTFERREASLRDAQAVK